MFRQQSKFSVVSGVAAVLVAGGTSWAAFQTVDTFEAYTTGQSITGSAATGTVTGNGWTVTNHAATDYVIASDPAGGSNKVLHANTYQSSTAYRGTGTTIADNTNGTVFFRFRRSTTDGDLAIGVSQDSVPSDFSDLAGYALLGADSASNPTVANPLRIRDSGTSRITNALAADTWYSVWFVLNNTTNTYQAYLQGGAFESQTQLFGYNTTSGFYDVGTFGFRNTAAGAINAFEIAGGGGGAGSSVYIDDLYIDSAGTNLTNPVPEPASLALVGMVAFGLTRRRRR